MEKNYLNLSLLLLSQVKKFVVNIRTSHSNNFDSNFTFQSVDISQVFSFQDFQLDLGPTPDILSVLGLGSLLSTSLGSTLSSSPSYTSISLANLFKRGRTIVNFLSYSCYCTFLFLFHSLFFQALIFVLSCFIKYIYVPCSLRGVS